VFFESSNSRVKSAGWPNIFTAIIAFVRGDIAFSTWITSRQNVSGSISTKTGIAPQIIAAVAEALIVYGETITSSP